MVYESQTAMERTKGHPARSASPTCVLVGDETFARRNNLVTKLEAIGLTVARLVQPSRSGSGRGYDFSQVDVVVMQVDGLGHSDTAGVEKAVSAAGVRLYTITHQRSSDRWKRLENYVASWRAEHVKAPASAGAEMVRVDFGKDAELTGLRAKVRSLEIEAGRVVELTSQLEKVQAELTSCRDELAASRAEAVAAREAFDGAEERFEDLVQRLGASERARAAASLVPALIDPAVIVAIRTLVAAGGLLTWESAFDMLAVKMTKGDET